MFFLSSIYEIRYIIIFALCHQQYVIVYVDHKKKRVTRTKDNEVSNSFSIIVMQSTYDASATDVDCFLNQNFFFLLLLLK
jgi:hypothetical protein